MDTQSEMNHVLSSERRLETFFSSPFINNMDYSISNSPIKLAEAGFIRMPKAKFDEVECRLCGAKYSNWSGESPLAVHRTLNPKCSFLNTPSTASVYNNKLDSLRRRLFQGADSSLSKICDSLGVDRLFIPKQGGNLLFESFRRLTFLYKDYISPQAELYAEAGFVYNVKSKSVVCVFCDLELDFDLKTKPHIDRVHYEKSPSCCFVNMFDVGNISMEAEKQIRDNESSQNQKLYESNERVEYAIKHVEYEDVSARLGTYSTWPKWLAKVVPCHVMAECGFYYTGFSDKVTCFACGVGLSDWSPEAVPAVQHAKASPHCVFMLKFKGKDFIDSAQNVQLIVEKDCDVISADHDVPATNAASSSSSSPAHSTKSPPAQTSPSSALGSPVLNQEAITAALAFRYPNTELLIGTLKARDDHYRRLCEKSQEVLEKEELCKKKEAQFQAKEAQLKAERAVYRQQITAKEKQLQRTTHELEFRKLVRTEMEQKYVDQIQQQKEMLHQQKEKIDQRDQVLEYKEIQILDQEKHIQSLMAELNKIKQDASFSSDDEESTSSDLENSKPDFNSNLDEIPMANCKVCLIKASQIMFLPCKHICCCDSCASKLRGKSCPICRQNSTGFEKVYLI